MIMDDSLAPFGGPFVSYAVVDLDAVAHNVGVLRSVVGSDVELFAVVKANAYGHGAVPVARAALAAGADRLAVGRVDEGIELRRAGIDAPILALSYTLPVEADALVRHDVTATVATVEGARALSHRATAQGKVATAHLKVDTGMGRYGLLPDEVPAFMAQVADLPALSFEGIFTHFSVADAADKGYTRGQFAQFQSVIAALREAGHTFALHHAANSAAAIDLPETYLDAVRPGIALYGLYPSTEVTRQATLRPVLSLVSHVGRVRMLPTGASVGYGRAFIAPRPTRVALVPVGYGDGYHRLLSGRGVVLIRGQRAPIIGRICMDQFMVDVTAIDGVAQDDPVVLIGEQGGAAISAEEVAGWAETINYEVVTALTGRLPRVYVRGGEVTEVLRLPGAF